MTVKLHLQRETVEILKKMADEAGVGLHDICEIAVFNLVGLWLAEKGEPGFLAPDDVDVLR